MQYNYYMCNEVLVEGNDKEQKVAVIVSRYNFLFIKQTVKRPVQCHAFGQSPLCGRPNDKHPVNTSHGSRFVLKCFTAVLSENNSNSYTVCVSIYKHVLRNT